MKNLEQLIEKARQAFTQGDQRNMPYPQRLLDWDFVDEVIVGIRPRYKTSELSGDMWRQSVFIVAKFKGVVVFEELARSVDDALARLYAFKAEAAGDGIPEVALEQEQECCDQPCCANKAVNFYFLKKIFAGGNSFEKDAFDAIDGRGYYRKFCNRHARRGDCSLDDADHNYIPIIGGPENASMPNADESPSLGPFIL